MTIFGASSLHPKIPFPAAVVERFCQGIVSDLSLGQSDADRIADSRQTSSHVRKVPCWWTSPTASARSRAGSPFQNSPHLESKTNFNGIGGLRTYIRIVPLSLRHF